jgi:hypothetical protein
METLAYLIYASVPVTQSQASTQPPHRSPEPTDYLSLRRLLVSILHLVNDACWMSALTC